MSVTRDKIYCHVDERSDCSSTKGSHSWDRETEQGIESLTLDRRPDDSFDCIVTRLARVDKFGYLVVAM